MKLDKWPEEIECDGWRWTLRGYWIDEVPPDGYLGPRYIRVEKLHVPPTMKQIMEHLLKGGVLREQEECPGTYSYYSLCGGDELKISSSIFVNESEWVVVGSFCRLAKYENRFELVTNEGNEPQKGYSPNEARHQNLHQVDISQTDYRGPIRK